MKEAFSFKPESISNEQEIIHLSNNLAAVFEKAAQKQEGKAVEEMNFAAEETKELGGFIGGLVDRSRKLKKCYWQQYLQ